MKVLEHILNIIREVSIDEMWFGLMSGKGTTNAIFLFCKLQDKYMKKKKNAYYVFVDIDKAFICMQRCVLWWAMRKLKTKEWVIQFVKSIYNNVCKNIFAHLFSVYNTIALSSHEKKYV